MAEDRPDVEAIFHEARSRAPKDRTTYLDEVCGDDAALRQRVEQFLNAQAEIGSFLESPAAELPVLSGRETASERSGPTLNQPMAERPGTVIGAYKLLEQIGEGGMGVVWMAEQTQPMRRKVALKILKPGMDTRQVVARFEAERQALAMMDHANIAKVHDGGATPSGRPYFVMELVKGIPITAYCDQNQMTPRERLELFIPVCQAVQHAHQKGIIHRDLKPSNVLVTVHDGKPTVKIIDFGIAKAMGGQLTDKTLFTGFAQMIGTPLYMSPEQAGLSEDVDTRSDIYSLGVMLYELLTGATPFAKERFRTAAYDEICRIIREEEPPRPSSRLSESKETLPAISAQRQTDPARLTKLVKGELDWIVMKCLEKDRNRRYETANDLSADAQRYLAGERVMAVPPSVGYRLRKVLRKNAGRILAAVLVMLAVIFGSAVAVWQAVLATQAKQVAENDRKVAVEIASKLRRRLYVAQLNLGHRLWERGELDELATVLDEFRRDDDLKAFEWHWLDAQARAKPRLIHTYRGHERKIFGAAFSPNGTRAATCGEDRSIHLWDAATGAHPLILRPEGKALPVPNKKDENCVSFSPDGRLLASACDDGSVRIWDLPAGKLRWSRLGHQGQVFSVDFSRDGLFATAGVDKVVRLWDPTGTAPPRELTGHDAQIQSAVFSPDGQSIASADRKGVVNVWDIRTGKIRLTLRPDTGVVALAYSPDGSLLATGELSGAIRLWEAATGKGLFPLGRHTSIVRCLRFSPDGKLLGSCGDDGCLRLCSMPDGAVHHYFKASSLQVWCICFSRDSQRLLSASTDCTASVWEMPSALHASRWAARWQAARHVAFAPQSRRLVLSTAGGRILCGDAGAPVLSVTLPVQAWADCTPAFSPDGNELAFLGSDFTIRRWRFAEQRELAPRQPRPLLAEEPDWTNSYIRLVYLRDNRLAALYRDGTLLLGNGERWQEYQLSCRSHSVPPLLAPLTDGKTIAVADEERSLLLNWNLEQGRFESEIPCRSLSMYSGHRPDGKTAAFGYGNGNIQVVELASGKELASLVGHRGLVSTLALSPDGKTLASGGHDGTVRLWHLATGQELFVLENRGHQITSLAFSSDGQVLAVAGDPHDNGSPVSLYHAVAPAAVPRATPKKNGR